MYFQGVDFAFKSLKLIRNTVARVSRTYIGIAMIISCPDCATRFRISAKAIGPNGRTVRCASCSTTWFVPAEEGELTLDRLALDDIEASEREVVVERRNKTAALKEDLAQQSKRKFAEGSGRVSDKAALAAAAWKGEAESKADDTLRGAHTQMREMKERKQSRRRFWNVMLIWLIPLLLLAGLAVAAYVFRQDIVDRAPKSASLYQSLGIDVSGPGLSLTPPMTRYAEIDGKAVLVVEGAVKNISNEALDIPMVTLSLHNSSGQEVAQWNVELERLRLNAKETADYISQYPSPPIDAVELRSRFSNEMQTTSTPVEITSPE